MMQRFDRTFVHGADGGDDYAEGDDNQQQHVLDGADDEEVQPEGVYPVRFLTSAAHSEAVSEANIHGEL